MFRAIEDKVSKSSHRLLFLHNQTYVPQDTLVAIHSHLHTMNPHIIRGIKWTADKHYLIIQQLHNKVSLSVPRSLVSKLLHEFWSHDTSPWVNSDLHSAYLLVDVLHKLQEQTLYQGTEEWNYCEYDLTCMIKSTNLCFQSFSRCECVIKKLISYPCDKTAVSDMLDGSNTTVLHLNCFAPHDNKLFGTLHQESREFVTQDLFDFIRLFNFNRYSDRVNRWLY